MDVGDNFNYLTTKAVKESQRWIELITGDKFKHPDNLIKSLQDGFLLCRLVDVLKDGSTRRMDDMKTRVAQPNNLSLFQTSCREDFGLQEVQLFHIDDLDDFEIRGTFGSDQEVERETFRRLRNILLTLYWLGRAVRLSRPDTNLDLESFEGLVHQSNDTISPSFDEGQKSYHLGSESKSSHPIKLICKQEHTRLFSEQCDDDDDEAPSPPRWKTFPGGTFNPGDIRYFDEDTHFSSLNPETSSSSSSTSSSFVTKECGTINARTFPVRVVQCPSSPLVDLLSASPETLTHDDELNFEGLLRDVENLSRFTESCSLEEDFDEVGFEEREEHGEGNVEAIKSTPPDNDDLEEELGSGCSKNLNIFDASGIKLERRKSDFMQELLTLEEATRKYDDATPIMSDIFDNHVVTLQSPELLKNTGTLSATLAEIIHQNSIKVDTSPTSPTSSGKSIFMERFSHDLENIMKVEKTKMKSDTRLAFDSGKKKMEEWSKRVEEELKTKFERDQDIMKEKLEDDLKRAEEVERMKQIQEMKFLKEEVIEVKNKKSFTTESSKIRSSYPSLFAPLPHKNQTSPDLPYFSLTSDWLNQSFSTVGSPVYVVHGDADVSFPSSVEIRRQVEEFEEPAWMNITTENVDKLPNIPVRSATIEMIPDSLTTSSESINSINDSNVGRSATNADNQETTKARTAFFFNQVSSERDDSLHSTTRISSAHQDFESARENTSTHPPQDSNHHHPNQLESLLTPTSDRCTEVYRYTPPSTINPHKRNSKAVQSSVSPNNSPDKPDSIHKKGEVIKVDPSTSIDYLFSYHADELKRRYYWTSPAHPTNCVDLLKLGNEPDHCSPSKEVICSGCGLHLEEDLHKSIYEVKNRYHIECLKCQQCEELLNSSEAMFYLMCYCNKCLPT